VVLKKRGFKGGEYSICEAAVEDCLSVRADGSQRLCLDSGATRHFVAAKNPDVRWLRTRKDAELGSVKLTDGTTSKARGERVLTALMTTPLNMEEGNRVHLQFGHLNWLKEA
jgi:hypothetical protein